MCILKILVTSLLLFATVVHNVSGDPMVSIYITGDTEIIGCQQDATSSHDDFIGPFNKIWGDTECRNIGNHPQRGDVGKTLSECKKLCKQKPGCTAINYHPGSWTDCVLRACPLPVPQPQWDKPPYLGYAIDTDVLDSGESSTETPKKIPPAECYSKDRVPCSDFPDSENFPHPDQCNKFLKCVDGRVVEKTCRSGKLYNHLTGWCEYTMKRENCMCPINKGSLGVVKCQSPFRNYNGQCLHINNDEWYQTSWDHAREECQEIGGDLAESIDHELLINFVKSEGEEYTSYWVGASDHGTPRDFHWISGNQLSSGWRTDQTEPDYENPGRDCVYVRDKGLGDLTCGHSFGFICSQKS